jgi:hypothetical protein
MNRATIPGGWTKLVCGRYRSLMTVSVFNLNSNGEHFGKALNVQMITFLSDALDFVGAVLLNGRVVDQKGEEVVRVGAHPVADAVAEEAHDVL